MLLPNQLNRLTADALCTVIALGFLFLDNQRAEKSDFLFEDDSAAEHQGLSDLMQASNIAGLRDLAPVFVRQGNKQPHPFIYAKRQGFNNDAVDEMLNTFVTELEQICNDVFPNLKGAYIGGIANSEQAKLLCPSLLYQYQIPDYIDVNEPGYQNNITSFYNIFSDTTEKILDLFSNLMSNQIEDKEIHFWSTIEDLRALVNTMPQNIQNNQLFASIHGLITSMTLAPHNTLSDDYFNVELALSTGTTKVASCIPCAIFAMSQNAPASYTHFGRGDYWNLPTDCDPGIKNNWINFVDECYQVGVMIISDHLPNELNDFFSGLNSDLRNDVNYIPNVFLSALTFPSSFISKITNTINALQ